MIDILRFDGYSAIVNHLSKKVITDCPYYTPVAKALNKEYPFGYALDILTYKILSL